MLSSPASSIHVTPRVIEPIDTTNGLSQSIHPAPQQSILPDRKNNAQSRRKYMRYISRERNTCYWSSGSGPSGLPSPTSSMIPTSPSSNPPTKGLMISASGGDEGHRSGSLHSLRARRQRFLQEDAKNAYIVCFWYAYESRPDWTS